MKGCLTLVLLCIGGVGFFVAYVFMTSKPPEAKSNEPTIKPGATVKLVADDTAVALATESQFYERMTDRVKVRDINAIARMISVSHVPNLTACCI